MGGDLTKLRFNLKTFDSDTMLNHYFSHKLKLIRRCKFNNLTITLTLPSCVESKLKLLGKVVV